MDSSLKPKRRSPYITPRSHKTRTKSHNVAVSSYSQQQHVYRNSFPGSQRSPEQGQWSDSTRNTRTDNRGLEFSTDDDLDQVIVAVDKKDSGTVGCSYYSAEEERLYLLGDIRTAGPEVIDSCQFNCILSASRDKY